MLVVIPPSVRHEESLAPTFYEDHLLERVSLLELRLAQLAERLSTALELMLRQARTTQSDHFLLETLIESLGALGVPEKDALARKVRARAESEARHEAADARRERILKDILLGHEPRTNADVFARLVREAIKSLAAGDDERHAFQTLERAAQISPANAPLLIFLAENLFRADKFAAAEKHLARAFEIAPAEPKIWLLSGVLHADRGEAAKARGFFELFSRRNNGDDGSSADFCVNYAEGFLAAAEENWIAALGAFAAAMKLKDAPETQYLTACAYFHLEKPFETAAHLKKAVARDDNFADAWFMLGVVARNEGDAATASDSFERAWQSKEAGAQCLEFLKRKNPGELERALPFLHFKQTSPRLLTGGSRRLTKIFREEIYKLL